MAAFGAETITQIGTFSITNSLLDTLIIDVLLIGLSLTIYKKISIVPNKLQNIAEAVIEPFYDLTYSIAGTRAVQIFPFFMTFFLFILFANWSGLLPGVGTLGFFRVDEDKKVLVPLIRAATSDVNTTLGLALVSAVATHILSLRITGLKDYIGRYFSLNPINLFIGVLEIISEITKVISLSFRLFGNIFAGEVVLSTISGIFAFFFPLPFMLLEIVVGLVQALVFSMLTMAFMAILTTPHHVENIEVKEGGEHK